jgi:hypothetical protein
MDSKSKHYFCQVKLSEWNLNESISVSTNW